LILSLLIRCVQVSVQQINDGRKVLMEWGDILEARLKYLQKM